MGIDDRTQRNSGDRQADVPSTPTPLILAIDWPTIPGGGLDRYVRNLAEALSAEGRRPPVVAMVQAGADVPQVTIGIGPQHSLVRRMVTYARAASTLSNSVDLVDAHFALVVLPCLVSRRIRRIPLVVHFHGPWAQESASDGRSKARTVTMRLVERLVYRRADRLVVLSFAFKQILVEQFGVSPWAIDVVRPGVESGTFGIGDKSDARRKLSLPADAWVVMAARRLVKRTGVDVLLNAWALGRPDNALLLIVGEGAESVALRQLAAALGIEESVRFLGRLPDDELILAYQASDVAVVPSRALEGYGLVVLEAMACGLPVVATDVGGLAEAVGDSPGSAVVEPENPAALAAVLAALRSTDDNGEQIKARRAYALRHSWAAAAAAHRSIYRSLLDTGEGGVHRRRVVYLDHTAQLSGGELALLRLIPHIPGIEAHVIVGSDGPLARRLLREGVSTEVMALPADVRDVRKDRVTRTPGATVLQTCLYTLRLAWRLRRLAPDLVHTNSLKSAIYGGIAARLAGKKVVWHVRDRIAPDYLPARAVRAVRLLARVVPHAILVDSDVVADTLPPGCRIYKIPSPVPDLSSPRRTPPVSDDAFHVVMVGRLAPWKGQDLFVRAFEQAFPSGSERATIVGGALFGEESYAQSLTEMVRGSPAAERIALVGHVDDVKAHLRTADVLVHASLLPEPFGLIILEAMSAGVPVIAVNSGGPTELIVPGQNGLLFESGSEVGLTDQLRALRADPKLRAQLVRGGRRTAAEFVPELIGVRIAAAYAAISRGAATGSIQPAGEPAVGLVEPTPRAAI